MSKMPGRALLSRNKVLIENFSYITLLQVFILVSPLITYPYIIGVIGRELYGWVITAQVLVSYVVIVVNFGSDRVCAKHVSINRDNEEKLSEIVWSVLFGRAFMWGISLLIYVAVVLCIPSYRSHSALFFITFGQTMDAFLFPQFFYQGMEKMKYSSLLNIGVKLFFILLVFVVVKEPGDYLWIPILYSSGFLIAGIISILLITKQFNVHFKVPTKASVLYYFKDSSPLFATDIICTVKDKLNYFLLGAVNMGDVVVYDLGAKLTAVLAKPGVIISTVLFPRFARDRNENSFKKVFVIELSIAVACVIVLNIFLPFIASFMLRSTVDLLPLRIYSICPIFLTISSYIFSNCYVAFGHNKYALYSIIVTTVGYLVVLAIMLFTHHLDTILSFVILTTISYLIELVYRLITCANLLNNKNNVEG